MPLQILGLSDPETRAYAALARVPSASVQELALALGVDDLQAADVVEQLARRLLVVRRPGNRCAAVRPSVALGSLLARREEDLGATRAALDELDDAFRSARPDVATDVVLDVAHGRDEIADRMNQIQVTARSEVLSLVKAPVIASGSSDDGAEDDAVRRGVEYRVVLERSMLEEEPRLVEGIHRARAAGEQVRVAGHVPTKLFVVDREVALVPLGSDSAVLLGAGGLVDALVALFEAVWERGQERGPRTGGARQRRRPAAHHAPGGPDRRGHRPGPGDLAAHPATPGPGPARPRRRRHPAAARLRGGPARVAGRAARAAGRVRPRGTRVGPGRRRVSSTPVGTGPHHRIEQGVTHGPL